MKKGPAGESLWSDETNRSCLPNSHMSVCEWTRYPKLDREVKGSVLVWLTSTSRGRAASRQQLIAPISYICIECVIEFR